MDIDKPVENTEEKKVVTFGNAYYHLFEPWMSEQDLGPLQCLELISPKSTFINDLLNYTKLTDIALAIIFDYLYWSPSLRSVSYPYRNEQTKQWQISICNVMCLILDNIALFKKYLIDDIDKLSCNYTNYDTSQTIDLQSLLLFSKFDDSSKFYHVKRLKYSQQSNNFIIDEKSQLKVINYEQYNKFHDFFDYIEYFDGNISYTNIIDNNFIIKCQSGIGNNIIFSVIYCDGLKKYNIKNSKYLQSCNNSDGTAILIPIKLEYLNNNKILIKIFYVMSLFYSPTNFSIITIEIDKNNFNCKYSNVDLYNIESNKPESDILCLFDTNKPYYTFYSKSLVYLGFGLINNFSILIYNLDTKKITILDKDDINNITQTENNFVDPFWTVICGHNEHIHIICQKNDITAPYQYLLNYINYNWQRKCILFRK